MSGFGVATAVEGELNKKQEQALATMKRICKACDGRELTFKQLKEVTKLSMGVLSKHLRELIRQKTIEGKVRVNEKGKLEMVFIYDHSTSHAITMKGKKPQPVEETSRIYMPKDKKKPLLIQHGYTKNVKGKKKGFFAYSEPKEM